MNTVNERGAVGNAVGSPLMHRLAQGKYAAMAEHGSRVGRGEKIPLPDYCEKVGKMEIWK